MRSYLYFLVAGGLLLSSGMLFADALTDCQAVSKTRSETSNCLNRALQEVDKEMDDLVAAIHRKVYTAQSTPTGWHAWRSFDDAQGMFVAYRGVTCNWQYNQSGQEGSEQLRACMIKMTKQRNADLREWLKETNR